MGIEIKHHCHGIRVVEVGRGGPLGQVKVRELPKRRVLLLINEDFHTMVLINLKTTLGSSDDNNGNDEFLYETKLSTKVDDLIESLVNIHNARVRSHFIITTVKELATYGVTTRRIDDGDDEDDDQKVRAASHCPLSYIFHDLPNANDISYRLTHHH
jgi:hypothetical protein